MASSVVRELVTLWGFDIDKAPLKELDVGLNTIKSTLTSIGIAVGATTAAVGFLLKGAGEDEQTLIAFETMLQSGEKAKELFAELKQFADFTPFETKEVVKSGKQLLAFGVEAADITSKLTNLGNIAAGVGKDKFETLIRSFGKIRVKGKASMEELNMLLEAGVPILDQLAKNLNVSNEQLFKMISSGKVGFKDVDKALFDLSNGTGKFAGLMEKQSKSFFGLVSTILGQLDNFMKEIGAELLPFAKEMATAILTWFNANRKLIKQNALKFVKNLVSLLENLVFLVVAFAKSLNGIVQIFGGWNSVLDKTFKIFTLIMGLGLLTGIGLLAKGVVGLALAFKAMGISALFAQLKMLLIPIAIGAAIAAIGLLIEDIIAFSEGRDSVIGLLFQKVASVFEKIKMKFDEFKESFRELSSLFQILIAGILFPVRLLGSLLKNIGVMIDVIKGRIGVLDGVKKAFSNVGKVFGIGSDPTENLSDAVGFSGITDFIRSKVGDINVAKDTVAQNNNPVVGLGAKPFDGSGKQSKSVSVNAKNEINLNVTGMTEEVAKDFVSERLGETLDDIFRGAVRDGDTQVER